MDFNLNFFTNPDKEKSDLVIGKEPESEGTKKKKRSKKNDNAVVVPEGIAAPIQGADVAEVDYAKSYSETNSLIRGAIMQADELNNDIKNDLDTIRSSKTLKNKYTYITNLTASASSMLSTKIAAIRELDNNISQSHRLELDRMKALKVNESETNDDMKMMDIYSAFVNTPIGTYTPAAPSIQDLTIGVNADNSNVNGVEMVNAQVATPNNAQQNLTAEQNRMRLENNPNIDVVVRFDQATGQRCFDVIDKTTGASVPNYPRPDAFLLEDTTIDVHSGIARNRNINSVWPLVIDGGNNVINEY